MRVAVICNKTGIKEKDDIHSGFHFAYGFEGLGDTVDIFSWKEQETIKKRYDLYLCVDSSESYEIRKDLRPLAVYNGDTHMPGGMERDFQRSRNADLVFNGNYEHGVELMKLMGINSIWLPLGFDKRFDFKDEELENKDVDVAMVGHPNSPQRVELWEFLQQNYNCLVGDIDAPSAYKRAKIVVNQPTEPWNNIYNNRLLEGLASGCFVLQKELSITSYEKLFPKGEGWALWHDLTDLKIQIDQILSSWEKMRSRAIKGRQRALNGYSYRHLCQIIKNYYLNLNGKI
jgi:glycosyltransferase involved in cell wall biosynthesis